MSKELSGQMQSLVRVSEAAESMLSIEAALLPEDYSEFSESLVSKPENIKFSIQVKADFSVNVDKIACLDLFLQGSFSVDCQRCMGPQNINLEHKAKYLLVETAKQEQDILNAVSEIIILNEQDTKKVVRVGELDLQALVVEELRLNVPLYPRHEKESDCVTDDWATYDAELIAQQEKEQGVDESDKQRPFAGLDDLLKH